MIRKVLSSIMVKAAIGVAIAVVGIGVVTGVVAKDDEVIEECNSTVSEVINRTELLGIQWPECFVHEKYEEPLFIDDENRTNQAFNVADFGEQGKNGWFYRYGEASKPTLSRQIGSFDGERYFQDGVDGLEIKRDFFHTANDNAAILEWRAAETGAINLLLTYVKNVNGDENPSYPDGVYIDIYKEEELLESHQVEVFTNRENLLETSIDALAVEEDESIFIVVDDKGNNAYDGGLLYVAIEDATTKETIIKKDITRIDNHADYVKDFGEQGSNGWSYMYGKSVNKSKIMSSKMTDGYMNYTSPALQIGAQFLHPAINDSAIIRWEPARDGQIEIRGTYTKFEQNDGNPNWPDGVTIQIYLNEQKLFEQAVSALGSGNNVISFREKDVLMTTADKLYFVVDANNNASYDGGCFDIEIIDRTGMINEEFVEIDESEIRQNMACVACDFGSQGNNGWFFQEGYQDEPFGAYNMLEYYEDDKYIDASGLEIKRDFVNVGENGKSAVIKWKVAQNGIIAIDADYTKLKNEDINPSWPDGTRVSLYYNDMLLRQEEFAADVTQEVTKTLDVEYLQVARGDYITLVINGKNNSAYDGGRYNFAIRSLSGLVGKSEKDIVIPNDAGRTNNANVFEDFGQQGANGWFYQYGYDTNPFFAVNVEKHINEGDKKYITNAGIEIKKDYIMPAKCGRTANVKWKVAEDGYINIFASYTKLLNEDANPDWPDGTVVTLLHNSEVLRREVFDADTQQEIKKNLDVRELKVKKDDYITLIVDSGKNAAYDGGLYSFEIEDAQRIILEKKNDSGVNYANLEVDFGTQGNNGWYYLEGESVEKDSALTKRIADNTGYLSKSQSSLEMKKDFVQPGLRKKAMYQWIVAKDGKVDVVGTYLKFGHNDPNKSWPDGTSVEIYLNNTLLKQYTVQVLQGEGNDNKLFITLRDVNVKKGDRITFAIDSNKNTAWDGGRLAAQIKPSNSEIVYTPAPDNIANLEKDFGSQGNEGWYYGFGNSSGSFELADCSAEGYGSVQNEGLLLKKDGVHPSQNVGAIYRWVVGNDGKIDLNGTYFKSKNEDASKTSADGVKVEVYKNGTLIEGMTYDIGVSNTEEVWQHINAININVARGDKIDFIIKSKANAEWDYGRMVMQISSSMEYMPGTDNETELATAFGEQGNDGWYYGICKENGIGFIPLVYDSVNQRYYNNGKPELKKDFVEPGNGFNAAYKWLAAEDGIIVVEGEYTKYTNTEDKNADGVSLRIFHNLTEKIWIGDEIKKGGLSNEVTVTFKQELVVKRGDQIIFAVNPEENDSYDGGKLSVRISPKMAESGTANLEEDFGEQGSNGWYYGTCEWDGKNFKLLEYDTENQRYDNEGKPELKKDFVEPGNGLNAAYKWLAGEDGVIVIEGEYTKYANAEDVNADGVCLRIFQNLEEKKWIGDGINKGELTSDVIVTFTEELEVKRGDQIIFAVNPEGNDSYDGGKLSVKISPKTDQDNTANLEEDFGEQGSKGWYYGTCEWDGKNFKALSYDTENERYYHDGKPELKKDCVEPGNGLNAAYKWLAGEDGVIVIEGEYTKYANAEDVDANGVCLRIFQNLIEKKWIGDGINKGGLTEDVTITFTQELEVKKGDQIIFAVNPEGNDSYDGGKLSVKISPKKEESSESEYEPDQDNTANLEEDFGEQGSKGWYYGTCEWDGKNFKLLEYDTENHRYFNNGKPELKKDFVEPGNGFNAAYQWIAGEDGIIVIEGEYIKYANAEDVDANGVCLRIFQNLIEKKWIGDGINKGGLTEDVTITFTQELEVKKGDQIIFAVNPEGNDSYDGGKLSVKISPKKEELVPTVLACDFMNEQLEEETGSDAESDVEESEMKEESEVEEESEMEEESEVEEESEMEEKSEVEEESEMEEKSEVEEESETEEESEVEEESEMKEESEVEESETEEDTEIQEDFSLEL